MQLTLITKARYTALVARASVKARLGIEESDTSKDAILDELIKGASSAIEQFLGFELARQRYQEKQNGTGLSELLLARFPVDLDAIVITFDGVSVTDFEIFNARMGQLQRDALLTPASELLWVFTYTAGWIVPDAIRTWAQPQTYTLGQWARPTNPMSSPLLFECTTAGATSGAEPTWPTTPGATIASGTATFTARSAHELPAVVSDLCYIAVKSEFSRLAIGEGFQSLSADGVSATFYSPGVSGGMALPDRVERALRQWRAGL